MYEVLVFIHVVAAVMGLGAVFGFPIVARSARTKSQAQYALELLKRLEILPKAGSIILLLTGLLMAAIEPALFKQGWYIASIVIYLAAQVIVIGMLPNKLKAQKELLEGHKGDDLPSSYIAIGKQAGKLEAITHLFAFLLIVLMVFKPF